MNHLRRQKYDRLKSRLRELEAELSSRLRDRRKGHQPPQRLRDRIGELRRFVRSLKSEIEQIERE